MATQDTSGTINTSVAAAAFSPSGTSEPHVLSSSSGNLNLLFNLGQLNVDASMTATPSFTEPTDQDLGPADFQSLITWYALPNQGWHKLFKFQVDGDNPTRDVCNNLVYSPSPWTDIRYTTDPDAWLKGTDMSLDTTNATHTNYGAYDQNTEALKNAAFNLLASCGPDGSFNNYASSQTGSTAKLSASPYQTNNFNATGHEDSIAKDYLRHLANEVMGGYSAGAKKGLVDIFANEEELLGNLEGAVNTQVYTNVHDILTVSKTGSDVLGTPVTEGDASSNMNGKVFNPVDNSNNLAREVLLQILNTVGDDNVLAEGSFNGIDRLDNLLTPNDASGAFGNSAPLAPGDAAYDYRRRRNDKDYMELLEAGDQLSFVVEIKPSSLTPIGNNPVRNLRYRVILTLAYAKDTDYKVIPASTAPAMTDTTDFGTDYLHAKYKQPQVN